MINLSSITVGGYSADSRIVKHDNKINIKGLPPFLAIFLSTTFYDLKVIFGYIGESPENFMSIYTHEV